MHWGVSGGTEYPALHAEQPELVHGSRIGSACKSATKRIQGSGCSLTRQPDKKTVMQTWGDFICVPTKPVELAVTMAIGEPSSKLTRSFDSSWRLRLP